MGSEEVHFRVLQLIQRQPRLTQRELAQHLGVSLGKANYCLNALIEKGFVKAENFRRNDRKLAYLYLLTPAGLEEKAGAAVHFLRRKMGEYEALKAEIADLQSLIDMEGAESAPAPPVTTASAVPSHEHP
jgi:EPS-associated MarR family transcriptional regulator